MNHHRQNYHVRSRRRKPTFWLALLIGVSIVMNMAVIHKYWPEEEQSKSESVVQYQQRAEARQTERIPEEVFWHRRALQADSFDWSSERSEHINSNGRGICPNRRRGSIAENSTTTGEYHLTWSGFSQDIRSYLESQNKSSSSFDNPNHATLQERKAGACFYPPETACDTMKYSVLLVSEGNNLRSLFLNALSFMSYPSVQDVSIVVLLDEYSSAASLLIKDKHYGSRIVEWGKQGTITLILRPSLWDAIVQFEPKSEAILWINGDMKKTWTATNLKRSFQLWKKQASALVAVNQLGIFGSFDEGCVIPQLHQIFLHRNLLCYLNHPVTRSLKKYTEHLGHTEFKQQAIGMLLENLSDGIVSLEKMVSSIKYFDIKKESNEGRAIVDYFGCCRAANETVGIKADTAGCFSRSTSAR